jgi:autotransporter translocation and assembly factor TamB
MQCAETLYVDGGTGEIDITKSVLGGLKVEQGVGEFNFSGTINGDVEVDGGVGEINLNLTNPASDFTGSGSKYKMDIDTGIGSNTVNYDVSY